MDEENETKVSILVKLLGESYVHIFFIYHAIVVHNLSPVRMSSHTNNK